MIGRVGRLFVKTRALSIETMSSTHLDLVVAAHTSNEAVTHTRNDLRRVEEALIHAKLWSHA